LKKVVVGRKVKLSDQSESIPIWDLSSNLDGQYYWLFWVVRLKYWMLVFYEKGLIIESNDVQQLKL
jgi:hypothetical protein